MFTTEEAYARGFTKSSLAWAVRKGEYVRVRRGVLAEGPQVPTAMERALADVMATGQVASGPLAAVIHEFDGVGYEPGARVIRRRQLPPERIVVVRGIRCTDRFQTLVELAPELSDDEWEQALESAERRQSGVVCQLEETLPELMRSRRSGAPRIRRVLARRPPGAPATGSLLETLFIQLAREVPGLPEPERQVVIRNEYGDFVARVDVAWPKLEWFNELDGQQHKAQPVYDAHRQTAVVAVTGWLCARFTWDDVVYRRATTIRRLSALLEQAERRLRS